ncbi:MAG: cation-transporting P-type ATPase [Chloroflexaceae bacterium]
MITTEKPVSNQPTDQPTTWHTQDISSVLQTLETDARQGLPAEEARRRLEQFGLNELEERGGKSPLRILWEQFTSTMVLILIAAAVISAFLGKPLETIAISAIVVLFGILGFVQEYRAERAINCRPQAVSGPAGSRHAWRQC